MSILSVDLISPIGSGTTITLNATEVKTGTEITVGTGASIFSPAGNTLTLGTNSTERLRITNAGALGLSGTNYGSSGQVLTSAGSGSAPTWSAIPAQVTIANNANDRVITGGSGVNLTGESNLTFNGNELLTVSTDSSAYGTLNLDGNSGGRIQFEDNDTLIWEIYTNTNEFTIYDRTVNAYNTKFKAGGNVEIENGNLKFNASGKGIDFSASSNVGGMTSELLDDYEEGSFSPTLVNGNNGYRFQHGTYTKIGNLVTFTAYIETSATPPSGNLAFGNLPFTSIGSRSWVFPFHTNRTSFGTNSFDARAYMGGTDTNIYIYYPVNSSSSNFQPINQNGMNAANASAVWISGSYQTAS